MQSIIDYILNYAKANVILTLIGILTSYQILYLIVGFFSKKKVFKETSIKNKYGIIIAARNEEKVIGNLLISLNNQTYDKSLYKIFVVSDNSTDNTANIARSHGATVYERFDLSKQRKGYALQYLFTQIERDYKINSFDGFIFFDGDNLVDKNFITEINKAFVEKGNIVVGYRNIKNFDTNIISSAYGVHFYRSILNYHRPRERFNLGTHIAGTGYVIDSKLLLNGWNYYSLTEDTLLTLDLSSKGIKISFCESAVFYDEQPTNFKTSYRQRIRWTKGRLDAFITNFPKLIISGIKRFSFTLYDLFFYSFPWPFYNLIKVIIFPIILGLINKSIYTNIFWIDFLLVFGSMMLGMYFNNLIYGLFAVIREWDNIHAKNTKKILAIFTYPWFNLLTIFLAIGVLINPNVKWKKIIHNDNRTIEELDLYKK